MGSAPAGIWDMVFSVRKGVKRRETTKAHPGGKKDGSDCFLDSGDIVLETRGIAAPFIDALKPRVGVDQQGEDGEGLILITLRYVVKLGEFLTGWTDEIGTAVLWMEQSPHRTFGLGKGGSTKFSEYTAGVDLEGDAFGKEKLGLKH